MTDILKAKDLLEMVNEDGEIEVKDFEGNVRIDSMMSSEILTFKNCRIFRILISSNSFGLLNFHECKIDYIWIKRSYICDLCIDNTIIGMLEVSNSTLRDTLILKGEKTEIIDIRADGISVGSIALGDTLSENNKKHITDVLRKASPSVCPEEGSFIAYKTAMGIDENGASNKVIVKLFVPVTAKRINPFFTRKCRCDGALVLSITDKNGNEYETAESAYYPVPHILYQVRHWAYPNEYNGDPFIQCCEGIHFYLNKNECL